MNTVRVVGDVRLALPTLGSWLVLAAFAQPEMGGIFNNQAVVLALGAVCCILGLLCMKKFSLAGLWLLLTSSLLFSFASKLPTHVEKHPWNQAPVAHFWWTEWAIPIRSTFLSTTEQLPGVGGELIPGLAIGDTSRVSEQLSTAMKTVSLTHITAVSGANCVIVTATVMAVLSLCGAHRKIRLVVAVAALCAFVVLVTPQPSVLRAATMALIVIVALYRGRPSSGIPILAVASLILLLWDPWLSIDFGMILSVSATAGLLLFSEPIMQSLSRFLPAWLAILFSVPLAAQLTCQPFIILLTPTFPTYGVLANVIAGPAAPLATIVGLIACLVNTWAPLLAVPLMWIAWLPAQWIGNTALSLSTFPIAQIPWTAGIPGFAIMASVSIAVLILLLSAHAPWRRISGMLLTAAIALWAMTNVVQHLNFLHQLPATWEIAACDVGQGDGLIIRSAGHIAVIDVGRKPQPMTRCLEQLGITHVDLLVLTHFDKDHVGGLSALFGKVSRAIVGKPENTEDQELLEQLSESGAEVIRGLSGMTGQIGEAHWEVLWPDGEHPLMDTGNPGSVTILVTFPEFNALFLGDQGKESQLALLNSTHLPNVDVVKVAHHGSADQSATLYELLQPEIGIFSVGADNDYGHPRRETLNILEHLDALTPRTDEDGLVLVSESSTGLSVWTER